MTGRRDQGRTARGLLVMALAVAACGGQGPAPVPSPSVTGAPSAAPTVTPSASAAPARLPGELVGTWVGEEADVDLGIVWASTYRIRDCSQHAEPWKAPAPDQVCGEWFGTGEFEGTPARCRGTLSWVGATDDGLELLGTAPVGIDPVRCWDAWRIHLTPDEAGGYAVETFGDGNLSTTGTVARSPGS